MIKRFLIILTCLLFVTGCGEKIEYTFKDKENYNFIKFETNKINDLTSIFNIKTKGKVIGYDLTYGDSITDLTLKDLPALHTIAHCAFAENSIKNISISNVSNVETLQERVFYKNSIVNFDLSVFPKVKSIGYNFMSRCKGTDCMTKLKIDNPLLEAIEDFAFGANYNLKTVEMGENPSLTTYREGVFLKSPVEDIIIPKNLTTIGNRNFIRYTNIKAKSVTVYGDNPLRFNGDWQRIRLINNGSNNCPVIPEGENSVTCS